MSDPTQARILALLEDLSTRLERVEDQLGALNVLQTQAPAALAITVDTVDSHLASLQDRGVDVDARLRTSLELVERLTRPETAAQLQQVLDLAQAAPGTVAGAVDTIDGVMSRLQDQGVDVDQRMQTSLSLVERLTRPQTQRQLEQALDLAEAAPGAIAGVVDTVDSMVARLDQQGIDLDARTRDSLALLERITRPETVAAMNQAITMAEAAPGMIAGLVDTVDAHVTQLHAQGVNLDERVHSLTRAAEILTRPELLDVMCTLLEHSDSISQVVTDLLQSGLLEPEPVRVVGNAGKALAETDVNALQPMGLFALARSANDPDVNRALVFTLSVARSFGRRLAETSTSN